MHYLPYIGVFFTGLLVGYLLHYWLTIRRQFDGIMWVTRGEDRMRYLLELVENPELLEHKPVVIFKVVSRSEPVDSVRE